MKQTLPKNHCVTILLNTHRTSPENEKDPILLKNLCREAEERLMARCKKSEAKKLIQKIYDLSGSIDHTHNLDSLILFVNFNIAAAVKLPINVEERIILHRTFATRDLIRNLHQQVSYYVLILSQHQARLIQAASDRLVEAGGKPFPMRNRSLTPSDKLRVSMPKRHDDLVEKFFNRVDKEVQSILSRSPLPLIIYSDERNYHHYLNVADKSHMIWGCVKPNPLGNEDSQIVHTVWLLVQERQKEIRHHRIKQHESALDSGNYLSDLNDIWRALKGGMGLVLFVEEGYFQSVRIIGDTISTVSSEEIGSDDVLDDIVDEMIELNMSQGGETAFLPKGLLEKFQKIGLITRY